MRLLINTFNCLFFLLIAIQKELPIYKIGKIETPATQFVEHHASRVAVTCELPLQDTDIEWDWFAVTRDSIRDVLTGTKGPGDKNQILLVLTQLRTDPAAPFATTGRRSVGHGKIPTSQPAHVSIAIHDFQMAAGRVGLSIVIIKHGELVATFRLDDPLECEVISRKLEQ